MIVAQSHSELQSMELIKKKKKSIMEFAGLKDFSPPDIQACFLPFRISYLLPLSSLLETT